MTTNEAEVTIKELWVYPVKACQGVQVSSASLTPTGLKHDRTWCIVDLEGTHAPKLETISQRRMPCLATISVSFHGKNADDQTLCLDAPGMQQLHLSLDDQQEDAPVLTVECAGATAAGPWSLGFLQGRQHAQGSKWVTDYLNQPSSLGDGAAKAESKRFINGKTSKGTFALVRCCSVVELSSYPPIFPLIERAKTDANYKLRFEENVKVASDFSPFLLLSDASARFLASKCQVDTYPTTSFRGNIIVDGKGLEPWAEESWSTLAIKSSTTTTTVAQLRTIKQCPRCTVPCRNQKTGKFLFSDDNVKLWKVLKSVFPLKFSDPEWGTWAGAYFGVYMGYDAAATSSAAAEAEAVVHVGDRIVPGEILPWDTHLQKKSFPLVWMIVVAVLVALIGILVVK